MSTLNEIPKNYSDFIKKINLDPKKQFPLIELQNNKKIIVLNNGQYELFKKENKETQIKYSIEEKSNYINKNKFEKKNEYDLKILDENNNKYQENIQKIDDEIEKFKNQILDLKEKTKVEFEKKKNNFLNNIRKEIYDEKKFKYFTDEENFKEISEHITVIPTPPKQTDKFFIQNDKKPETCNYCKNDVKGIFVTCEKCKIYICQDCYQILSTTFFHQHPLITERNNIVEKTFDSKVKNTPKELIVSEKKGDKKIEIKMENTGTETWEKNKVELCVSENNKYKVVLPGEENKKKVKPGETGDFNIDIPWEQLKDKRELILQLKSKQHDCFFGKEVTITIK